MPSPDQCAPKPNWARRTRLAEALLAPYTHTRWSAYGREPVVELGVTRKWVYLVTRSGALGIAYAEPQEPLPEEILENRSLADLMALAWQHPLLTSVALAAANAAMQLAVDAGDVEVEYGVSVVDLLDIERGDRVALVGYMEKVAAELEARAGRGNVTVYEDNQVHRAEALEKGYTAKPGNQLLAEAEEYTVIVATGASLLDPRLATAVEKAKPKAFALVGPTASFHPETARALGATAYGGTYIPREARDKVLKLVRAGYGYKALRKHVKKWSIRLS